MYSDRLNYYKQLEDRLQSKILVYITGDRPGLETQIHPEVIDYFSDHLDTFNSTKKISLYLYSLGGSTLAAWNIANLIRHFCEEFEIIIPSKARSAATLISISANNIIMTKQATLGPIDPSVNGPLNPQVPGAPPDAKVPISVEAVAGYLDLARKEINITRGEDLTSIFLKLVEHVHPITLGDVYRSRFQIQMLAEKLLRYHMLDEDKIKRIVSVLCSESGSHDYTIDRKEAVNDLGLPVEKPDEKLYEIIKNIYKDIKKELELGIILDAEIILGQNQSVDYLFKRTLIESINGGSHKYITEGTFQRQQIPTPQGLVNAISNIKKNEGWKHENQ